MVIADVQSVNTEIIFSTCKGTNDIEIKVDEKGVEIKYQNAKNSF